MIKYTDNFDDIYKLWGEAFGDSREDVEYFVQNIQDAKCLAYYDGESIASMLYIIKCTLKGEDFNYVYAVSTLKEYRSKGYATKLLGFAKSEYQRLCLIPANEQLIAFYKKCGYDKISDINDIKFNQPQALIDDYLFEGCELENPIIMVSEV